MSYSPVMDTLSRVPGETRLKTFFATLSDELNCSQAGIAKYRDFARDRLLARMRKRAKLGTKGLRDKALDDFRKVNQFVKGVEVVIDPVDLANARHFIMVMLERYTTSVGEHNIQQTLDLDHLYGLWKFGPGSSNGIAGSHAAEKIQQVFTCTPSCFPYVLHLRRTNPYFVAFDSYISKSGVAEVYGSRMTSVSKNEETDRTIAIEPLGNMVMQLAAGQYLEGVLRYIGLDITTQEPKNQALALRGSIDGFLATIDLKSASDMISIDLVRKLLPSCWFNLLMNIRSGWCKIGNEDPVELGMISTMGNGFTFPLMTLVICSLIYAMRARNRSSPNLYIDWSNTAVYGDDIVLPSDEYDSMCQLLGAAGLVVNHDKSYHVGPFRESCGGDYYEGYDVTPFYVKDLSTDSSVYVAINQTLEWAERYRITLYRSLALLSTFIDGGLYLIPEWHNPDQGVLVAQVGRRYKYLQVVQQKETFKYGSFEVMLAVGGYLTPNRPDKGIIDWQARRAANIKSGSNMFYTPRQHKNEVRVRRSRLPNGYLDGYAPEKRSVSQSSSITAHALALFAT